MIQACAAGRRPSKGTGRRAIALLLVAAIGLGILPFSIEVPLLPTEGARACRFEPIDVCGAGDASPGVLADTPLLPAAAVTVVAQPFVVSVPPRPSAVLPEGFAPGVYRPPRPATS